MTDPINNKLTMSLLEAIVYIQTIKEAKQFFRDLLTESEIKEFANRWQAAKMLDNNVSYVQIAKQTGLSSTTIARIAKWLNNGAGGYKLILDRIAHHSPFSYEKGRS
jgi:TrpR-related protein YerC/YecD